MTADEAGKLMEQMKPMSDTLVAQFIRSEQFYLNVGIVLLVIGAAIVAATITLAVLVFRHEDDAAEPAIVTGVIGAFLAVGPVVGGLNLTIGAVAALRAPIYHCFKGLF